MIRRDPQEIADFFGCYVARDRGGSVYSVYTERPLLNDKDGCWCDQGLDTVEIPSGIMGIGFHKEDWMYLYEPRYSENQPISDNKPDPYYAKQPDSDNKHQSEVYTHQEYCICMSCNQLDLAAEVNGLMKEGWRPQGGLSVEPLKPEYKNDYCLYQAMVRGI